jgi:DNA-binding transcriptional MerR regulator/DNA-directed RNA polymerase subunit L
MSSTFNEIELHPISNVERDTGISKDTLRIWERRYGFPKPTRNEKGERLFSDKQVLQLLTIRRLMDHGMRAGQVVPLNSDELQRLADEQLGSVALKQRPAEVEEFVQSVQRCDVQKLEELLHKHLMLRGLEGCVTQIIAPLMGIIGDLWAGDRLEIFEEHLLSRQISRFLDLVISRTNLDNRDNPVILATLPGETHTLGLLMTEAILLTKDIPAVNLGGEIPIPQVAKIAQKTDARSVGLSFSASFPSRKIRPLLKELLEAMHSETDIWIGGSGVAHLKRLPAKITLIKSFDDL